MIVVPVYNMILTPNATVFFQVDQLRRSSGGSGVAVNERVILAPLKENNAGQTRSAPPSCLQGRLMFTDVVK